MEFQRVGQHTVKCLISEEEIYALGYSIEEIMSNGERTQEFMNYIFDMAEQEFQMKFDMGVKTVRADFLPDHTISLTFSEHPASGDMMEHLKDIVNGLLNSVPEEKWKELKEQSANEAEVDAEAIHVVVLLKFKDLDTAARFAKHMSFKKMPPSSLYKHSGGYYIIMDLSHMTETEVKALSMLTDEYVTDIEAGSQRAAFIEEHGECIIGKNAVEMLAQL